MNILLAVTLSIASHAIAPETVTYQVITNDFNQHNTYLYNGVKTAETDQHAVYAMSFAACEIQNSVLDVQYEQLLINPHSHMNYSKNYSFKKDFKNKMCFLTVRKPAQSNFRSNNFDYHHESMKWYPKYNNINKTRPVYRRLRASKVSHRNIVIIKPETKVKVKKQHYRLVSVKAAPKQKKKPRVKIKKRRSNKL